MRFENQKLQIIIVTMVLQVSVHDAIYQLRHASHVNVYDQIICDRFTIAPNRAPCNKHMNAF